MVKSSKENQKAYRERIKTNRVKYEEQNEASAREKQDIT
jgi:hypothetical protein